jgi:tetratricopeptide (TPR) repeat protein
MFAVSPKPGTTTRRFYLLALLIILLGGCGAGTPTRMQAPEVHTASQSSATPAKSGLSENLLYQLLAAEFAGNQGDLKAATDFYSKAAEETDDSRVAARASYIAVYAGDYSHALTLLARWNKLDPANPDVDRMYAITYFRMKKPEQSAQYLEKIIARSKADDLGKAVAVKTMLHKEPDTETSLALLVALNKIEGSKNLHMLVLQARYEAELKHYDAAQTLLDKVSQADPGLDDAYLLKSRILMAQGKFVEATRLISGLVEKHPKNVTLRLQYARMLLEQKKIAEAREQFRILGRQQPDNADVIMSLALLSIDTGNLDKAKEYLNKLIRLDKRTDVANYYLGRIAQSQKKNKLAISYYVRVAGSDYAFDAHLRISVLFAQLGRVDESLDQLQALAEQQTEWPLKVRVYLTEGEILRSQHRYKEGFEMLSQALEQKPDDPDLLYARALIAEKVNRIDITESDLLKLLAAEPKNANALNALGYTLADKTKRYKEALGYIQRAAVLLPDDPAILDSLGWVNYRLGNMQDALKWLGLAFEKLKDAEIAAHYGEVLWKTNQHKKAREIWQRGRELDAKQPVLVETLKRFKF